MLINTEAVAERLGWTKIHLIELLAISNNNMRNGNCQEARLDKQIRQRKKTEPQKVLPGLWIEPTPVKPPSVCMCVCAFTIYLH